MTPSTCTSECQPDCQYKNEMNLQQLKQNKLKEFEKGCNTDNISDPPSDLRWIKSFLSQAMDEIQNATIEAGQEALPSITQTQMSLWHEGFDAATHQSHSALESLKIK